MQEVLLSIKSIFETLKPIRKKEMNTQVIGTENFNSYKDTANRTQYHGDSFSKQHYDVEKKVDKKPVTKVKHKSSLMTAFKNFLSLNFLFKKETMYEQLAREISDAETSRLSKIREAAAIQAEIKRFEEHRDQLIATFEKIIESRKQMAIKTEHLNSLMEFENH